MENTYKSSLPLQILKLIAAFVLAWFLILFIFAAALPGDDAIPDRYNLPMVLLAIVLSFAVNIILDFNAISRLKGEIQKSKADIDAVNETCASLIDKAERVADKYRNSETQLFERFADARKGGQRIRCGKDFKAVMEAYPELKSNEHTQRLLDQIQTTEQARLTARTNYSTAVAKYNAKIHSFPVVILRRICKWEDVAIEVGVSKDQLVTDEELGI